jgi:hypothetical protein
MSYLSFYSSLTFLLLELFNDFYFSNYPIEIPNVVLELCVNNMPITVAARSKA